MDNNPAQAQPVNSDIQEDAGETDDRGGQAVNSDTEDEDAADTDEVEANIASLVNLVNMKKIICLIRRKVCICIYLYIYILS